MYIRLAIRFCGFLGALYGQGGGGGINFPLARQAKIRKTPPMVNVFQPCFSTVFCSMAVRVCVCVFVIVPTLKRLIIRLEYTSPP